MPPQPKGATLIADAWRPPHLTAERLVQAFVSNSKPLLFECSDGQALGREVAAHRLP